MSKNKVFILINIRNEWVTWIVKHLRSPVALLDRCCRVPFWLKVGEISRRWQFCDMENATKYLVVGSQRVKITVFDQITAPALIYPIYTCTLAMAEPWPSELLFTLGELYPRQTSQPREDWHMNKKARSARVCVYTWPSPSELFCSYVLYVI